MVRQAHHFVTAEIGENSAEGRGFFFAGRGWRGFFYAGRGLRGFGRIKATLKRSNPAWFGRLTIL
jgi:hypothetical protein